MRIIKIKPSFLRIWKLLCEKGDQLQKDKLEHKVVSYFILRKLAELLPLKVAKKLTLLVMDSKELLDMTGLGTPELSDIKADEKGVEEAVGDIVNKRPYRYKVDNHRVIKDLLRYLHLD